MTNQTSQTTLEQAVLRFVYESRIPNPEALPTAPNRPYSRPNHTDLALMNVSRNVLTVARNPIEAQCRVAVTPQYAGWLRRTLEGLDTGVCPARDLKEARAWLKVAQGFVAVICEEKLADGTGWELLHWLRHEKENKIPVLILCGQPSQSSPCHSSQALTKSVEAARLR